MAWAVVSVLTFAFWVAICAAAPEFIWQGFRVALSHPSWADLVSAVLIGLVLAFFVEPLMERGRELFQRTRHHQSSHHRPHNALFTASLSFAFALVSVCIHDAITAFVLGRSADHSTSEAALVEVVTLTVAWAIVPFAVMLAWLSVRTPLAIPMGVIAVLSPSVTGWLFDWPIQSAITTTIPCVAILGFGYRLVLREPTHDALARCVAAVGAVWLVFALVLDIATAARNLHQYTLYTNTDFWIDVRFYVGWSLGLVLAPSPHGTWATRRTPPRLPLS